MHCVRVPSWIPGLSAHSIPLPFSYFVSLDELGLSVLCVQSADRVLVLVIFPLLSAALCPFYYFPVPKCDSILNNVHQRLSSGFYLEVSVLFHIERGDTPWAVVTVNVGLQGPVVCDFH